MLYLRGVPILLLLLAMFMGCGEGAQQAENTESAVDAANAAGATETAMETHPVEVEAAAPPYPDGTLDPALISPDEPVAARQLFEAYFAWNGMKVTVVGYPYIPYMRETAVVDTDLELCAEPGSSDRPVVVKFNEPLGVTVWSDQLVAFTGTLEMSWTGDIQIIDAVMVEAPDVMEAVVTSPWVYDGTAPIPVDQLAGMVYALLGMEVTVEGHYHSTTTSTTSYGVTVRVDLSSTADTFAKLVACEMAGEIPEASTEALTAGRDGVLIKGTVAGESFDMVGLEGCVLVNR